MKSLKRDRVTTGLLASVSVVALGMLGGIAVPNTAHAFECANAGAGGSLPDDGGFTGALACGLNAQTTDVDAVAIGDTARARDEFAIAVGPSSEANGEGSIAIGSGADAEAEDAIALGRLSEANFDNTIAIGNFTDATAVRATALGTLARATASEAIAIGSGDSFLSPARATGTRSIAIGGGTGIFFETGAQATGVDSVAIGNDTLATGTSSVALGKTANATADNNIAIGNRTDATFIGATAIGGDTSVDTDLDGAQATAENTTAVGADAEASEANASAYGRGASADNSGTTALGASSQASADNATAVGISSQATGADSVALGTGANASANITTALGSDAVASAMNATAIGGTAMAAGTSSTAIGGIFATASGGSATAIGAGAIASGGNSTALGRLSEASGTSSFAAGINTIASSTRSAAIGAFAEASGSRALALGELAIATHSFSVALGRQAVSNGTNNISIGSSAADYTLAGLGSVVPPGETYLVTVDTNGNLSAVSTGGGAALLASDDSGAESRAIQSLDDSITANSVAEEPADMDSQIATLFEMVETAAQERTELLARIDELEQQLALSESARLLALPSGTDIINSSTVTVANLELAGIDSSQATQLVNLNEQMELEALALRDTATREGWLISDKYHTDSTRLLTTDNPVRLALGDDGYQQYLQDTYQPWQVVVESVLSGSTAAQSGLQVGDVIQGYAGANVFSSLELQMASASASRDELIEVTILRNGEVMQLYIDGGPLGIRAIDSTGLDAPATGGRMI